MKEAGSPLYPTIMAEKEVLLEQQRTHASQQRSPSTYQPLGLNDDLMIEINPDDKPGKCAWKVVVVPMAIFLLIIHAMESGWFASFLASGQRHHEIPPSSFTQHDAFDVRRLWGMYSPYFDQQSSMPAEYPSDCEVTFLQVLARHGSRYPTAHKSVNYNDTLSRVIPLVPKDALVGPYEFLANYSYSLGNDGLTISGQLEMVKLSLDIYEQYADLINDEASAAPFIRASGSQRVIDSGEVFARALVMRRLDDLPPSSDPGFATQIPLLVLPEVAGLNNSLDRDACINLDKEWHKGIADNATGEFAKVFISPIANRLSTDLHLAGKTNLSVVETVTFMDLCAFETAALPHPFPPSNRTPCGVGISPFCDIFTDADFRVYDYLLTLGKYYESSHGSPLAPSTGVGFVNELIARLTGEPVHDHTSTNRTLNADPKTFPIGRLSNGKFARVFADFSHDNTIAAIHAALRLFEDTPKLPSDEILSQEDMAGFSAAGTIPFGARTVVEKLRCRGREEEDVRIIVNSRVMPLSSCGGDKYGRCSLSKFVDSLEFARSGGNWSLCFDASF